MEEDGPKTKWMRICGLEVNDDAHEEHARPEEGERTTDVLSGELIGASEVWAAHKKKPSS